jgi:hypothetical protein
MTYHLEMLLHYRYECEQEILYEEDYLKNQYYILEIKIQLYYLVQIKTV